MENSQSTSLAPVTASPGTALSVFSNVSHFADAQRMAKALASSTLVPESYRGENGIGNCLIAMDVAQRTGASLLAVVQNLNIIEGKPGWSSQYVIAALNSSGRFAPLRFDVEDRGKKEVTYEYWTGPKGNREKKTGKAAIRDKACVAWTVPAGVVIPLNIRTLAQAKAADLPIIEGPEVSIETAVLEGWYHRNGSKWKTMPDLMLRYRAAAFFGRLYAPDVLMGMHTVDEVEDIVDVTPRSEPTPPLAEPASAQPAETEPASGGRRRSRRSNQEAAVTVDVAPAEQEPENPSPTLATPSQPAPQPQPRKQNKPVELF